MEGTMTNYINADKLKELIDEKWKELADKNVKAGGGKWDAEISTYLSVLRLIDSLQQEQSEVDLEKALNGLDNAYFDLDGIAVKGATYYLTVNDLKDIARDFYELGLKARKGEQEQQEVNLEEFTEKMDAWKARFNHPDDIPIKATMAFTARMFYQYPDVARQWYEQLPKATMD